MADDRGATHFTVLGVTCDFGRATERECQEALEADILVRDEDDRATRLGYILDHAALIHEWQIINRANPEYALAYCPKHKT